MGILKLHPNSDAIQLSLWNDGSTETADWMSHPKSILNEFSRIERKKRMYLNKHYLPVGWKCEGIEEFPINLPYTGDIPEFVVGTNTKHVGSHPSTGLHNFTYDHLNERWWNNLEGFIKISRHYLCVLGIDFSPLVNGRRCEVVEAIRRTRTFNAGLQYRGIPTIQSASFGHPKHKYIVFDGLASNSPVAIEHMRNSRDKRQRYFFRENLEYLIETKTPSLLLVVGFKLDFDPGVPVKYYPCYIQHLRAL